jgi:hypothetical protein
MITALRSLSSLVLVAACGTPAAVPPDAAASFPDAGADAPSDVSTAPTKIESDVVPKVGRGAPPSGQSADAGPWSTRMMLATSADGKTFKRTFETISDQAGVPNAFVDREGRLRLSYVDFGNGNILATAVRNTDGTWAHRRISFSPALGEPKADPVDPTIVRLADGTYRLFIMHGGKFRSGLSQDGFVFVPEAGERFAYPTMLYDPVVVDTPTGWWLWANIGGPTFAYGKSADGLTFVAQPDLFKVEGKSLSVWSAAKVTAGYRISGGLEGKADAISAAFSTDGASWSVEGTMLDGVGADPKLEGPGLLPDHGYTQLPDGSHVIAYLARIPQ